MELKEWSTKQLEDEIKRRKQATIEERVRTEMFQKIVEVLGSPVGKWKVTTEGDVEGRSTKNLGIHEGHVADIAARLRKHCYYSLKFEAVANLRQPELDEEKGEFKINISLPIETDTWGKDKEACAQAIREWLDTDNTKQVHFLNTERSNYYAAVTICVRRD